MCNISPPKRKIPAQFRDEIKRTVATNDVRLRTGLPCPFDNGGPLSVMMNITTGRAAILFNEKICWGYWGGTKFNPDNDLVFDKSCGFGVMHYLSELMLDIVSNEKMLAPNDLEGPVVTTDEIKPLIARPKVEQITATGSVARSIAAADEEARLAWDAYEKAQIAATIAVRGLVNGAILAADVTAGDILAAAQAVKVADKAETRCDNLPKRWTPYSMWNCAGILGYNKASYLCVDGVEKRGVHTPFDVIRALSAQLHARLSNAGATLPCEPANPEGAHWAELIQWLGDTAAKGG